MFEESCKYLSVFSKLYLRIKLCTWLDTQFFFTLLYILSVSFLDRRLHSAALNQVFVKLFQIKSNPCSKYQHVILYWQQPMFWVPIWYLASLVAHVVGTNSLVAQVGTSTLSSIASSPCCGYQHAIQHRQQPMWAPAHQHRK